MSRSQGAARDCKGIVTCVVDSLRIHVQSSWNIVKLTWSCLMTKIDFFASLPDLSFLQEKKNPSSYLLHLKCPWAPWNLVLGLKWTRDGHRFISGQNWIYQLKFWWVFRGLHWLCWTSLLKTSGAVLCRNVELLVLINLNRISDMGSQEIMEISCLAQPV